MAFFGTLFNVAKVGVGILNNIVNPMSDAPRMRWFIELENGQKITLCGKYTLVHPNPRMVGTYDNNVTEFTDGAVVFADAIDNNTGKRGIYAFNNSKDTDYTVSFTTTGATGNTQQQQFPIPHWEQVNQPAFVEVTDAFEANGDGNCVVTPLQQDTGAETYPVVRSGANATRAVRKSDDTKISVPGNFSIDSVIASAVYVLYTDDKNNNVSYSWTSLGDVINGATVTNATAFPFTIVVNLTWGSPSVAFKFQFDVAAADGTTPATSTVSFPDNDRSIDTVNIAVTTPGSDPALTKKLLAGMIAKAKAEKRLVKAK